MQRKEIQRGDLFYYDFGKREGSVQFGERPVMVIQADNFNANTCHRSIPSDGGGVMGNKQTELNNPGNRVETVPVWVKPYLTIDEATAYTGIGRDKLYEMTSQEKCPFVLWVGNRRMIKRRVFDEYIEKMYSI